jgi:hypothetical protein
MLEIGILVFILLAVGYWATLWIMGRRDDVLHGQFVEFEAEAEPATALSVAAAGSDAAPSPVPTRPKPTPPAPKPIAAEPSPNPEALQSLLASIKQELKNAAKI